MQQQMDDMSVQLAGNFKFNGDLTGNFADPTISGNASLGSLSLRGRELGSVAADVAVSPAGVELKNGKLIELDGGDIAFYLNVPSGGTNNVEVPSGPDQR